MARNEEHTMRFLAKVLWKYRGTVKFREVMIRLLEFDCIRRNYSKGTLHNLLQQFRAWYRDPECKTAKKLPKSYVYYLEELKQADSEGLECTIEEPTPEEHATKEHMASAEPSLEEQYLLVEKAQKELKETLDRYLAQLEEQEAELDKQHDDINQKKHAASAMYYDKNKEYEIVLDTLRKQIVWQEMMK